jgi:hypothetical protein
VPLDTAYNKAGDTALLVLQSGGVYYYLNIDWGTIATGIAPTGGSSDLIKGLVATNAHGGVTVTVTNPIVELEQEYFTIDQSFPGHINQYLSYYMSVQDQVYTLFSGQNQCLLPQYDYFTTAMFEVVNNGAHVQAANISDVMWVYAGQANNVRESASLNVVRNTWEP